MITSKNRITRRTMLRGAGGVAIGLPFLEAMLWPGTTHAAATTPLRLVVFYSPGGTLLDQWRPTGTETNFTLSSMMAPLNPYKDRLLFLDGLDLKITEIGVGHPHSRGMAGLLTGTKLLPGTFETGMGLAGFADGPSVDQVIATRNSMGSSSPLSSSRRVGRSPVARRARCRSPQTKSPMQRRTNRSHPRSTRYRRSSGFLAMPPILTTSGPLPTPKLSRFWMQCWTSTPLSRRS